MHNKLQRVVIKKNNVTDGTYLFSQLAAVERIEHDAAPCIIADSMFEGNINLKEVILTNTESMVFAKNMFKECVTLSAGPSFNTLALEDISGMFENCKNLTAIPTYNFQMVLVAADAFRNCSALSLLPALDFASLPESRYGSFGEHLYSLKTIRIKNFGKINTPFTINLQNSKITAEEFNRFVDEDLVDLSQAPDSEYASINISNTPAALSFDTNVRGACNKGWFVNGHTRFECPSGEL